MHTENSSLFQLLKSIALPKGLMVRAAVYSVLNKVCDIVPEILIGISIDIVVNQEHSIVAKLGIADPYKQLYVIGAITALLWIFESVFEYLYSVAWRKIALRVQHDLRIKTYATLQRLDMAYFEQTTIGGLLNIVHDDVNQMEQFFGQGPNEIIQLTVNVLIMGCLFLYVSPVLACVALVPIPLVIGISYYFKHAMARAYDGVRQQAGSLSAHIAYRLQGIATIKSFGTEEYEEMRLNRESGSYSLAQEEAHRIHALYIPTVRMAVMVGFIASLVVGGVYALQGVLPINWYAALVFLTQRFLWPFTTITSITDMYERSRASAKRIARIINAKATITSGRIPRDVHVVQGDITFTNVSFAYTGTSAIFNDISFTVPARKTVAFVGGTGSGKSTIIKLLARLYDVTRGSVSIGGTDIRDIVLNDLRAAIGVVSQDVYIVDGTVADTIAYGSCGASREDIMAAARLAQAHDFIMAMPHGYDAKLYEHGKNLSGGQRQRLSIARALLKKSPILIFDEATSAVDNETEAALQQTMARLAQDHTIIIIAHRLATVRHADTIFVLDKGEIVESGSHQDLVDRHGAYARLWRAQIG